MNLHMLPHSLCVCVCHRYLGKQSWEGGVFVNDPLLPAGDSCALVNVGGCVSTHMLVDAGRSALTRSCCMRHRPAIRPSLQERLGRTNPAQIGLSYACCTHAKALVQPSNSSAHSIHSSYFSGSVLSCLFLHFSLAQAVYCFSFS